MTEFQRQLKDPRWQKKRLEILERDEWTCQGCADIKATLTVHHKSYDFNDGKFADIWDYNGDDLITLCEKCHSEEEMKLDLLKREMFFNLRSMAEDANSLNFIQKLTGELFKIYGRRVTEYDLDMIIEFLSYIEKQNKTEYSLTGYLATTYLSGGNNEH